jgi:hypothetical protein
MLLPISVAKASSEHLLRKAVITAAETAPEHGCFCPDALVLAVNPRIGWPCLVWRERTGSS